MTITTIVARLPPNLLPTALGGSQKMEPPILDSNTPMVYVYIYIYICIYIYIVWYDIV